MASRRNHRRSRVTEDHDLEITVPTMGWEQIDGDMDPGAYGGTIATANGHTIDLIKIQPVREYVGDGEAKDVGFPFWTKVATFDADDLRLDNQDVVGAMNFVGLDLDGLKEMSPTARALSIASALLDYGRADEGPDGWSKDIGIPDGVKWSSSNKVAGAEYLADEDEAFRDDVLGYADIKTSLEEEVDRLADVSGAAAWGALSDQALGDLEDKGFDPETAVCIGEFGDAVAVNGDVLVDARWEEALGLKREPHPQLWSDVGSAPLEEWLEKNGYEYTDLGGRVPDSEEEVSGETAIDAVTEESDDDRETVEAAAKSLDWWQENIPRGTSGSTSVWATRKDASRTEESQASRLDARLRDRRRPAKRW